MKTRNVTRKPEWLRVKVQSSEGYRHLKKLARSQNLTTVCEEARCPNIYECWGQHRTATFMLFGDTCTRACQFCAVATGKPGALNPHEPLNTALAVKSLGLKHAVITSVNRDDLADGGSHHFAATIGQIREHNPGCRVEVLVPDFKGDPDAIATVLDAQPEVFGHNTETVPSLYRAVRPGSRYPRTLGVLRQASEARSAAYPIVVKTGIMLGLGEEDDQLFAVMDDLRAVGCDVLTLGQYLQPTRNHHPVARYLHPEEFARYREEALARGFAHCEAGPLVRSSYHAHEHVPKGPGAAPRVLRDTSAQA